MSFNKYHDHQFLYLDKKNKREKKKLYYVKLSCALNRLSTSIYIYIYI